MRPFRYVQSFVDRNTGAVFHYFRRPGFKRVRLPGLPGSREFLDAYQSALEQPHVEIGAAKRSRAGTVSAAIVRYYNSSLYFGSLAPGTKAMRRAILERFRAQHGDRQIADLPQKFIMLRLSTV